MSVNLMRKTSSVLSMLVAMLLASCGGGGGGGGAAETAAADSGIMGLWAITETSKTSSDPDCRPPADPLTNFLAYVSQSGNRGNNLTMMFAFDPAQPQVGADGGVFTGTIASGAVSLTGSHPDGSGTSTLDPLTATVAASCNSLTGTASFRYAEVGFVCTGTTQFSGTRTVGSGCGSTGNVPVSEQAGAHNTPATAQNFSLSSVISGALPVSDFNNTTARDWYRVFLVDPKPVTATLRGPASQDMDLVLFQGDGTTIMASSTSPTSDESVSLNLAAGTYFIAVFPFDVTVASNYTLVVQSPVFQ